MFMTEYHQLLPKTVISYHVGFLFLLLVHQFHRRPDIGPGVRLSKVKCSHTYKARMLMAVGRTARWQSDKRSLNIKTTASVSSEGSY